MARETREPSQGYRLGPDILWKTNHDKVYEYKPHMYGSTVRPYDRIHEYKKVHEYTRIHEHSYREYASSYKPTYNEYKLNVQKKPSKPDNPPQSPQVVVYKNFRKRQSNPYLCYAHAMGPDIRVKEHEYKEYKKSEYQPTYREYHASAGHYMDTKWTQYNGNVDYILTPQNHYPLRQGPNEKHNGNKIPKEPTETSLSKVKPIVNSERFLGNEPDATDDEEPEIAGTWLYGDPTIENTPFVEEEDDFYAAPLVITGQVVTPLPIEGHTEKDQEEDLEQLSQEEPPEQRVNEEQDMVVIPVVAVAATGGHITSVQEADDIPQDQPQETTTQSVQSEPDRTDNEHLVAPVAIAVASTSSNGDVVPTKQDTAPEEPVEESGRWSSLTTHGTDGNTDASLTPVDVAVIGAVGGVHASQPDQLEPTDKPIADTLPVNEAPTTESAIPEAEIDAAPVEAAHVVAAAAVTAESAPSDATKAAADPSGRLPPEVVANIEAYSFAHTSEHSAVETVKRTLDMMY